MGDINMRATDEAVKELTGKGENLAFHEVDLRDAAKLDAVIGSLKPCDACIHFAGLKAVGESTEMPLEYYENNVGGTLALLKAMRKHEIKQLIFSSSATVYGSAPSPITEATPTGAGITNAYGHTKYVIEEILGAEIVDETDVFVDVDNHVKVVGRSDFDFTKLRRLDAEFVDERLSPEEVQAVTAHLLTNVKALRRSKTLERDEMAQLVRRSRVVEIKRKSKNPHSDKINEKDQIYVRGEAASYATLVLNGKLSVLAGVDGFRAEAGPWTVLGADALVSEEGTFVPDFSAHVATESVRCVHITKAEYERAITGRRRRGRRHNGTDGEESDAPSRSRRLGRRGEMAEKRRRLARMAGEKPRMGRAALDQFRGQEAASGALSEPERPRSQSQGGEESDYASSTALHDMDAPSDGYASNPETISSSHLLSSREDLLGLSVSGHDTADSGSGSD